MPLHFTVPYFTCKYPYSRSGAEGIRTPDLRRAKAALSRLSYGPERETECTPRASVLQRADCRIAVLLDFSVGTLYLSGSFAR